MKGAKFFRWLLLIGSGGQIITRRQGGMERAKSWLSQISSLKWSLVLQSLGAAALVLHRADTMTPRVEIVWFILEQPQAGGKPGEGRAGAVGMAGTPEPVPPVLQWPRPTRRADVASAHVG